ncbi:hypothetical protein ACRAQ7_04840 [Erythrobacter sp. W53]|uniref:hypothetical protein n=1 Tax=Erythrobacter sp. W53 TaxID=3425947 RepID=UPI003D769528
MVRALFAIVLSLTLGAPAALAGPAAVAPEGWQSSQRGDLTVYRSANGREAMLFREIADVTDPVAAVKMIADGLTQHADAVLVSEPGSQSQVAVHDLEYERRNVVMRGKVIGVRQASGVFLALAHFAPKSEPGLAGRMATSIEKMAALSGGSSVTPTARQTPVRTAAERSSPTATTGPAVSQVLFDLKYSYGVGGAVYPTYNLVALLEGGKAAKLGSFAVDSINMSALPRKDVGTWQRAGGEYRVRWQNGKSSDLKPTVGPPKPLPSAQFLSGTYQAIGGGGNTALGGQTLVAEVKQFTFRSDGTFSQGSTKSGSAPRVAAGARSSTAGRWSLDGPNLTLRYGNGRVLRTSVFYSASRKRSAKGGQYGVVWIGGEDYRRVR